MNEIKCLHQCLYTSNCIVNWMIFYFIKEKILLHIEINLNKSLSSHRMK
jgi:hypothetical protein